MTLIQFNKETECDSQEGVSPNQILYSGLISDIPDEIVNEFGGYKAIFNSLTTDDDSCLIIK